MKYYTFLFIFFTMNTKHETSRQPPSCRLQDTIAALVNNKRHLKGEMAVTWLCQLPVYRPLYLQTLVHRLQHYSGLLRLSSIPTYAALRPHCHRLQYCITLIRLSPWSWLLRRHEDVTLRKREQAGKDPGDFLTPADRSSVAESRPSLQQTSQNSGDVEDYKGLIFS